MAELSCLDCGGELRWYESVNGYRHFSPPPDVGPHPARPFPTREESTARGRALRESLGVIDLDYAWHHEAVGVAETVELEPHPAPIVPARPATDDELPKSAASIKALMTEHGWTTEALYAMGAKLTDPNTLVTHVTVEGARPRNRERIAAWWADGKFAAAYRFAPHPVRLSSSELRAAIKAVVMTCVVCDEPPHTHPLEAPCCPT